MPHGLAPHIVTFHTHVAASAAAAEAAVRGPFELYCRTRLYAKPWTYEQIRANLSVNRDNSPSGFALSVKGPELFLRASF